MASCYRIYWPAHLKRANEDHWREKNGNNKEECYCLSRRLMINGVMVFRTGKPDKSTSATCHAIMNASMRVVEWSIWGRVGPPNQNVFSGPVPHLHSNPTQWPPRLSLSLPMYSYATLPFTSEIRTGIHSFQLKVLYKLLQCILVGKSQCLIFKMFLHKSEFLKH